MAAVAEGSIKILLVHKIQKYTNISKGWFFFFLIKKSAFLVYKFSKIEIKKFVIM